MHGVCAVSGGFAGCACEDGYTGVLCESCATGYQDNDGDSICQPGCALAGLDCGAHGSCTDTSGTAVCACAEGYTGADCRSCAAGFQDHDGDGTCMPDCSTAALDCSGHGGCDDSSGTSVCACTQGYAGPTCSACADGYQDHDGNGSCTPACDAIACDEHQLCDDSTGTARCECAPGFGAPEDGGAGCEFQGIVQDPTFTSDPPVWTVSADAGWVDPGAPGLGEPGSANLAPDAACSHDRIEQEMEVPPLSASGPLRLSWSATGDCPSAGDPAMAFDDVWIAPDPSCPNPGEVSNGDFEGTSGWVLSSASIQPNIGANGSHGLVLEPPASCDQAVATGSLSIPTTGANALQLRYGGLAGNEADISLADWKLAHLVARGGGVMETVTLCLPTVFKGAAPRLELKVPVMPGICNSIPRRFYFDDLALVNDPTCSADDNVVNGSFERTDPALGWYLSLPPVSGSSVGVLETTTSEAKVGARSLHMKLLTPCAHATASTVITVATPQNGAGPAVKYWYRMQGTQSPLKPIIGSLTFAKVPFTTTWTARTECLAPSMAGMPLEFGFDAMVGGGCALSISEEVFIDDIQSTTDASCPAQ
ncbi:MAG: hypothetical protein IRZ16_05725 [Myxococcaceae bacterium]|nr:hypothetical protein [Myxococcaceae bacterium]